MTNPIDPKAMAKHPPIMVNINAGIYNIKTRKHLLLLFLQNSRTKMMGPKRIPAVAYAIKPPVQNIIGPMKSINKKKIYHSGQHPPHLFSDLSFIA